MRICPADELAKDLLSRRPVMLIADSIGVCAARRMQMTEMAEPVAIRPSLAVCSGVFPLLLMTLIAFGFGVHRVMAIACADMSVMVSMLNSDAAWAAAATGFMLSHEVLTVTAALVGPSRAIRSYIMCRPTNRDFRSVIAGVFVPPAVGQWRPSKVRSSP